MHSIRPVRCLQTVSAFSLRNWENNPLLHTVLLNEELLKLLLGNSVSTMALQKQWNKQTKTKQAQLATTSNLSKLSNSTKNPHKSIMKIQHSYICSLVVEFSSLTHAYLFWTSWEHCSLLLKLSREILSHNHIITWFRLPAQIVSFTQYSIMTLFHSIKITRCIRNHITYVRTPPPFFSYSWHLRRGYILEWTNPQSGLYDVLSWSYESNKLLKQIPMGDAIFLDHMENIDYFSQH